MRDALRQVKPTEFDDIVALVALYRPGPMQNIPVYARRKNGQEPVTYLDPRLEEILGATYGITVYQEQCMQIAKTSPGSRPPRPTTCARRSARRARADGVAQAEFLEGCVANGVPADVAEALGRQRALGRLLLQQVARRLLRADRVPDRLPEGATTRPSTWRR